MTWLVLLAPATPAVSSSMVALFRWFRLLMCRNSSDCQECNRSCGVCQEGEPKVMERWNDDDFARQWAEKNVENPSRKRAINLLVKIMADYLNAVSVPRHILDVGCGHGVIAQHVLEEIPGATLVGLDASPPM